VVAVITLGIETATPVVGVALVGNDGVLGAVEINRGRRHAETLTPAIQFLCEHAQIAVRDIAAIGVDVGPGLFTGMRVGIAAAKSMAYALEAPVVGRSSLELLAHGARRRDPVIAGVVDARKGEVFYAFFRSSGTGVQPLGDARTGSVEDFNADVMARGQDVLAVGDGAHRYCDDLHPLVEVADLAHPSAITVATLARAAIIAGDIEAGPANLASVQPLYLRAPDAEINWSSRA
jgi:tRNA threonylcarbamoyladenosine biosynthesis protein TsaB